MEDKIKRINDLIKQYYIRFGKFFPVSFERQPSDDEIIRDIEICLKTGKPYIEPDIEIKDDVMY